MPLPELAILLALAGVALIAAELSLPTHGLLGIGAAVAFLSAIGVSFGISHQVGLITVLASVGALPAIGWFTANIWPRSPIGRRLILQKQLEQLPPSQLVLPGQSGVSVTQLRPMGLCEFAGQRLEATSEHGIIPAGNIVTVVASSAKRIIVRSAI